MIYCLVEDSVHDRRINRGGASYGTYDGTGEGVRIREGVLAAGDRASDEPCQCVNQIIKWWENRTII